MKQKSNIQHNIDYLTENYDIRFNVVSDNSEYKKKKIQNIKY